ncbi:GTP-binding protein [Candidatus Saccharibacteria bacterium]|nr:GTP-binding protein [Candidatus Saccharibacteria bacterium]
MPNQKLPLVAIIGQTNAGKSALFNRMVGRQDAIVAREAGTTRDAVYRVVTVEGRASEQQLPTRLEKNGKRVSDEAHNDGAEERRRKFVGRTRSQSQQSFLLVDTAGLKNPEDDFEATIQDQIDDAVGAADLILLVKDITQPFQQTDRDIAKKALKSKKTVFLILNKTDLKEKLPRDEFLRLGIKDTFETSAEHNRGINQLLQSIARNIPSAKISEKEENTLKIALIGRPNVGKSHLFNTLSKKQQAIVADVAGTTRDINRVKVKFDGCRIELLDTAGVRKPGKIEQGIEKFSVLRTVAAIEEADICLLLTPADELNTALDQKLAGQIADAGKGLIIVVSKWDLTNNNPELLNESTAEDPEPEETTKKGKKKKLSKEAKADQKAMLGKLRGDIAQTFSPAAEVIARARVTYDFVPWAPLIFTSSITGKNVAKILEIALQIDKERQREIPTRKLNDLLQKSVAKHPPAGLKNTHPKFRYMVQTDTRPPWFVIYGSNFKFIHWSYKRYLERQMREEFGGFSGTPIMFSFRDEKQIKANREDNKV